MRNKEVEEKIHMLKSYVGMTHKLTDNQGRPKLDQAIETVLSYIEELEEKWERDCHKINEIIRQEKELDKKYLDKQVIRDKIALYELEIETLKTLYPKSYTKDDKYKLYFIKIQELKSIIGE